MPNYTNEEKKLAKEFADVLDDQHSLGMHLSYVHQYEEWSLREQLQIALNVPDNQVRTTRARYYNFLVRANGIHKKSNH